MAKRRVTMDEHVLEQKIDNLAGELRSTHAAFMLLADQLRQTTQALEKKASSLNPRIDNLHCGLPFWSKTNDDNPS